MVLCVALTPASALSGSTSDSGKIDEENLNWRIYLTASGNTATARIFASYNTSGSIPVSISAEVFGFAYGSNGERLVLSKLGDSFREATITVSDSQTTTSNLIGTKCYYYANGTLVDQYPLSIGNEN